MENTKQIFGFLKFGELEHLNYFRKGFLYMKTLSYFQKLEADEAKRADDNEGLISIYQPDQIKVTLSANGYNHEFSDLAGPMIVRYDSLEDIHVFCLFAITEGEYEVEDECFEGNFFKIKFATRFEKFGGYVVIITNGKEFLNRVQAALEKNGKLARSDLVEYICEASFHGDLPEEKFGFYKLDTYKEDREYRIAIYSSGMSKEAISLNVGDLSDITDIIKFNELDIKLCPQFEKSLKI